MKRVGWLGFVILCILISLYPVKYYLSLSGGLLDSKPAHLLNDSFWLVGFYGHITFGGIALLTGWPQFSQKWRLDHIKFHRNLGKVYIISAFLSSLCGIFIAINATGGILTQLGFGLLGVVWFLSTFYAYRYILEGEIVKHQKMMIYSYAACFAAVTLRIWLPVLIMAFDDFLLAYRIVAWLCWVPNLIVAYLVFVRKLKEA